MRTVVCEKCASPVPLRDDRPPPWCPICGGNLQTAGDSTDAANRAAANGFGTQTRIEHSDLIVTAVPTFNRLDQSDSPIAADSPAVPVKAAQRYYCLPCGCVYQVPFADSVESSLTALTLGQPSTHAISRLFTTGNRPCPTCGLVRSDEAVRWQFRGHATVLFFALLAACGIGALVLSHSPWIKPAAMFASAAAAVAALLHLWIALTNPNRGRAAKRERGGAASDIEVLKPGSTEDFRDPAQPSAAHAIAFLVLTLAPLPFLAPLYVHSTRNLPENPGLAPYVIGLDDVVRVPISDSGLRGVGGYWRASATAQLLNAKEVGGPAVLNANSRSKDWGDSIYASKPRGKANENVDLNVPIKDLYADVYVPDVPALSGKTLRVKVTLNVTYPVDRGRQVNLNNPSGWHEFADQSSTVSKEVVFQLAAGNDHRVYRAAWEYGAVLGGLLYFIGGVGLFVLTQGRRPGGYPPELVPAHDPLDTPLRSGW